MGQRHQIYLVLPGEVKINDNFSHNVIGLHNQWLFGQTAISQLKNCLEFIKNQDQYGPFRKNMCAAYAIDALKCIYSVNTNGYYHAHHVLDRKEEVTNPDNVENNDGITIIDCRDPEQTKYCFMWLAENDYNIQHTYMPISARAYINTYYGDQWLKSMLKHKRESLGANIPEVEKVELLNKHAEECVNWQMECMKICDEVDDLAQLLSPSEVESIFPMMRIRRG